MVRTTSLQRKGDTQQELLVDKPIQVLYVIAPTNRPIALQSRIKLAENGEMIRPLRVLANMERCEMEKGKRQ